MHNRQPVWRALSLSLILVTMLSCAAFNPGQTPRRPAATATQTAAAGGGGGSGSSGAGSGGGGSGSGGGGGDGGSGTNNGADTQVSTPNPTDPGRNQVVPYIVKQIETLGHETIQGQVCSITVGFSVNVSTPRVAFVFNFAPQNAGAGKWSYAYSIPSAGETHDASGSYTLAASGADGTLLLVMTGSDHVVFKGFDGKLGAHYKFELLPSAATSC